MERKHNSNTSVKIKKYSYGCPTCSVCFDSKDDIERHMRTHNRIFMRKCPVCDCVYKDGETFMEHVRTHSKEVVLDCDLCGKEFLCKSSFREHLSEHHGEVNMSPENNNPVCSPDYNNHSIDSDFASELRSTPSVESGFGSAGSDMSMNGSEYGDMSNRCFDTMVDLDGRNIFENINHFQDSKKTLINNISHNPMPKTNVKNSIDNRQRQNSFQYLSEWIDADNKLSDLPTAKNITDDEGLGGDLTDIILTKPKQSPLLKKTIEKKKLQSRLNRIRKLLYPQKYKTKEVSVSKTDDTFENEQRASNDELQDFLKHQQMFRNNEDYSFYTKEIISSYIESDDSNMEHSSLDIYVNKQTKTNPPETNIKQTYFQNTDIQTPFDKPGDNFKAVHKNLDTAAGVNTFNNVKCSQHVSHQSEIDYSDLIDSSDEESGDEVDNIGNDDDNDDNDDSDDESEPGEIFSCSKCGKKFKDQIQYNQHLMKHSFGKTYECIFCDSSFWKIWELYRHTEVVHEKRSNTCTQCWIVFKNWSDVCRHMRSHDNYSGWFPYRCDGCGDLFLYRQELVAHRPQCDYSSKPDKEQNVGNSIEINTMPSCETAVKPMKFNVDALKKILSSSNWQPKVSLNDVHLKCFSSTPTPKIKHDN